MNENPQPSSETKLSLAIIDQSFDAEQAAHREAVRLRTERLNDGNAFSRFTKSIWDNIAGDYMQLRDTRRARQAIEANGHVQMFEQSATEAESTRLATIDRFTSEYEETIHAEAGEKREILDSENELAVELKQVIRRNINGELPDAAAHEESLRILNVYSDKHGVEALKNGKVMTDNFFAIRDAVLGAKEHGESVDRVLENMTVTVGESRSDVRTEANYTVVDRAIDKLSKSKVGSLVGPEVVATTATLAGTLLRFGSKKVVGAAAMTVVPGAAAGLWAGIRENKKVKDERADHLRDMARGMEFEAGSKRREDMDSTRYEMVEAGTLADELRSRFDEDVNLDDHDTLRGSIDALAAVQARVRLSDQRKIDLISYQDGKVEQQRLALDIALAEAKTIASQRLSPEARTALGLPLEAGLNELLNLQAEEFIASLETDIASKDKAFSKLKRRRVALASAKGAVIGMTIGAVVQEGIAAFDGTRQGLVEQLWRAHNVPFHGEQHQTLLNGIVHGSHGQDVVTHHAAESTYDSSVIGTNGGQYELSADHNLVNNGNGTLDLVDKSGNVSVDNLPVNPDGSLPQSSIDILHSHGMSVIDTSHSIDIPTTQTANVSVDQYITNHPDQVTRITRDGWYDNNTPRIYDRNELGLHWGGTNGSNGNGGYAMSVATMTKNGSFSGNHSVDWSQQAHNGNLQLAISGSKGTQSEVFMVNIGPDGNVDIPAGSPAAQFFSTENGHTTFNGAYAEVVQKTGIDASGVEHVRPLATLVGHNNVGNIPDTVTTHTPELKPEYQITTSGYDTTVHSENFTEMAPVIPITSRRSMENLRRRSPERTPYGYYGGELTAADVEAQRKVTSPRLLENPSAQLSPREELSWYRDKLIEDRGDAYVREIEQIIDESSELSQLSNETRSIITIPVKASGNAEAHNIYNVLVHAYGQQDSAALAKSTILLHVNWFESAEQDPESKANIDLTLSEIERARHDFPDLHIAVVKSRWNESQRQGGIIGHVARRMNAAALLAVNRAIDKGRISDDHDVLIIRNDADVRGISKSYLRHYIEAAEANPGADVFTGTTQFGSERARELPGLVFVANFMQGLNILSTMRDKGILTAGGNFGIRSSMMAAIGVGLVRDEDGNELSGAGSDDVMLGRTIKKIREGGLSQQASLSFGGGTGSYYNAMRSAADKPDTASANKIGVRVTGARVDTDIDRQEGFYLQGVPIIDSWSGGDFDKDGHRERDASLETLRAEKLNSFRNPDNLIESIRSDMERTIEVNGGNSSIVRTALAFMFAGGNMSAGSYYNLAVDPRSDTVKFNFTPEGKKYVLQYLERDRRGKFDPFGGRLARQLYGQSSRNRVATHAMMTHI